MRCGLPILVVGAAWILANCGSSPEHTEAATELGQFRLGHNIAIADDVTRGPFSRDLSEAKLEATIQNAVAKRLRRYDGDGLYHLGIVIGGVVLAKPGIPVVYAPSSVLVADVTVFDNDTRQRLNEKPKRFTVGEGLQNAVPLLGSGMVRSPEEQLANLSEALASDIESWLHANPSWFAKRPNQVRIPYDITVEAPKIAALSGREVPALNRVQN